ncbi:protein phosphatase 2C domain-containing protein [Micromonospora sp. FIMYZ51]|uniref:protein phosphatase 2C domain-containing protein n=1 Tax=Micromonospora sp. FIMYZ51 TaxID=3051832 RepID=UPI0031203313
MPATNAPLATIRTAERPRPDRPSEDRVFVIANAVVVLDGASQPEAGERNGGWLADTLGRDVAERLSHSHDDLRQILADAIAAVAKRHDLKPGAAPSTTVSIARWNDEVVDILVLGDSPVVLLDRDGGLHQVRDDRLHQIASHQRQQLKRQAGYGFGFDDRDRWQTLVDAERSHRNRPGGYWIAEAVPEAAAQAVSGRWQLEDVAATVMMTDGVSVGVSRYRRPSDWRSAVEIAMADPAGLVNLVHDAEAEDPDGIRWPRTKRHDDKTLAVVEHHHG